MSVGAVVWITGLPSSGKSTFASRLHERLLREKTATATLDGDEVREALVPKPGYDPADRDHFYESLARLAALLARQGLVVLVPATATRRAYRETGRALAPRFVEVYLDVPVEECARRDAKGLYSKAARGAAPHLPGVGADYEPPINPDVIVREDAFEAALTEILRVLQSGSNSA